MSSSKNKSLAYVVPLILKDGDKTLNFTTTKSFPANHFYNSYIFNSKYPDGVNTVYLAYKKSLNPIFDIMEKKLINDNFIRRDEYPGLYVYSFKIPSLFIEDFKKFKEGKYSQMSEMAKNKILNSFDLTVNNQTMKESNLVQVLYKSDILKKQIEEKLNITLSSSAELSSIIDFHSETFIQENYINE